MEKLFCYIASTWGKFINFFKKKNMSLEIAIKNEIDNFISSTNTVAVSQGGLPTFHYLSVAQFILKVKAASTATVVISFHIAQNFSIETQLNFHKDNNGNYTIVISDGEVNTKGLVSVVRQAIFNELDFLTLSLKDSFIYHYKTFNP